MELEEDQTKVDHFCNLRKSKITKPFYKQLNALTNQKKIRFLMEGTPTIIKREMLDTTSLELLL